MILAPLSRSGDLDELGVEGDRLNQVRGHDAHQPEGPEHRHAVVVAAVVGAVAVRGPEPGVAFVVAGGGAEAVADEAQLVAAVQQAAASLEPLVDSETHCAWSGENSVMLDGHSRGQNTWVTGAAARWKVLRYWMRRELSLSSARNIRLVCESITR